MLRHLLLSIFIALFIMQNGLIAKVIYELDFTQKAQNRVVVRARFEMPKGSPLVVTMPTWTPGSYLIREYARNIETISARDVESGNSCVIRKLEKNRWQVESESATEVEISYVIYCREMSVRTNWVEEDFAFLTGAATFITKEELRDSLHVVRVIRPDDWPSVATSLTKVGPDEFHAATFDELVDSPILVGEIDVRPFQVGGVEHYLATLGSQGLWDLEQATEDLKRIVEVQVDFWGEIPYEKYWFINLATESGGGLEHDNCSILMTSRWAMRRRSSYVSWLGLASHEFFHTWNVRRLRPQVLKEYDYNQEQYFPELWIAEGITSYYQDLFVHQAGLTTQSEFIAELSKTIASVQSTEGRNVQSLYDSSFDAWIKFYRPDENARNSRISYYSKGAVVAAVLDAELRSATNGQITLQNVMQTLWEQCLDSGYTLQDFERICSELSGKDFAEWFDRYVRGTEELNFSPMLEWYGLRWKSPKPGDGETEESATNELVEQQADPSDSDPQDDDANQANAQKDGQENIAKAWNEKYDFGKTWVGLSGSGSGSLRVTSLVRNSPAEKVGINVGDEIVGFNEYRVDGGNWGRLLNAFRPGDEVKLLIDRRGILQSVTLKLEAEPQDDWSLQLAKEPSEAQVEHREAWLKRTPADG